MVVARVRADADGPGEDGAETDGVAPEGAACPAAAPDAATHSSSAQGNARDSIRDSTRDSVRSIFFGAKAIRRLCEPWILDLIVSALVELWPLQSGV